MVSLDRLVKGLSGIQIKSNASVAIKGIAEDSREVQPGFLFAGLPGTRTDGSRFVSQALRKGAAAILAQDGIFPHWLHPVPLLLSEDPRRTLTELSSVFYGDPSAELEVLGVTGTNGKTTVSYLIKQLLEMQGIPTGWIGTVGYDLGSKFLPASHTTPNAVRLQYLLRAMRKATLRAVSMEISSHALDQSRCGGLKLDIGILTNVTHDHLDYHGSFEAYLQSKVRMMDLLNASPKKSRAAIANADDVSFDRIRAAARVPFLSYGIKKPADVTAHTIRLSSSGSVFQIRTPVGKAQIKTSLLGDFNVYNVLAAISTGVAMGIKLEAIVEAALQFAAPAGRMEFLSGEQPFRVVVDYAHTDDALRNVLKTLRVITRGRLLVVFGCGGDRDREKRALMGAIACQYADFSYITSDNPRSEDPWSIIHQIEEGFSRKDNHRLYEDRGEAIEMAIADALPGDLVLIAGKGHEEVQILKDRTIPSSDRAIARDALKRGAFA
jgi:UDP-N-acetylmuramoyl-L-alanyl-D-glutamate--2,6-diaminopimelate ligase